MTQTQTRPIDDFGDPFAPDYVPTDPPPWEELAQASLFSPPPVHMLTEDEMWADHARWASRDTDEYTDLDAVELEAYDLENTDGLACATDYLCYLHFRPYED